MVTTVNSRWVRTRFRRRTPDSHVRLCRAGVRLEGTAGIRTVPSVLVRRAVVDGVRSIDAWLGARGQEPRRVIGIRCQLTGTRPWLTDMVCGFVGLQRERARIRRLGWFADKHHELNRPDGDRCGARRGGTRYHDRRFEVRAQHGAEQGCVRASPVHVEVRRRRDNEVTQLRWDRDLTLNWRHELSLRLNQLDVVETPSENVDVLPWFQVNRWVRLRRRTCDRAGMCRAGRARHSNERPHNAGHQCSDDQHDNMGARSHAQHTLDNPSLVPVLSEKFHVGTGPYVVDALSAVT